MIRAPTTTHVSECPSAIALPSERRFAGRFAVYGGKGKCEEGERKREREHGRRGREGSDITPIGLSEGGDGFACVGGRVIMTAHCLRYDRYRVAQDNSSLATYIHMSTALFSIP